MYKKVTKIKKITKKYTSPYKPDDDAENGVEVETESKVYGDTITMDIPFFSKMLEHISTKITSPAELQVFADAVVTASKEYPCLTAEWFEKLV